jgi:hypothetical protein
MALDTRGLASGFGQGFGLADQYYARQHRQGLQDQQNERADKQSERADESFDMQKQQFAGQQEDAQRNRSQEQAKFTLGKVAQGVDLSQDEMTFLKENPQYWPALDPETDTAIENAQRVIDPNDELGANSPEALYSMNLLFGHRVNRGEGGKKRIAGMYPGQSEGSVALDLEVEGPDGKKYNAPMTRNRGVAGADDEVLETPVGSIVDQVQGYRMLRNAFQGPEAQQSAARVLAALRGDQGSQTKGVNVNGYFVNQATGEQMGDFRSADQRQGPGAGGRDDPAALKEWDRFSKMSEEDKKAFLNMKRSSQLYNQGDVRMRYDQVDDRGAPVQGTNANALTQPQIQEQLSDQGAVKTGKNEAAKQAIKLSEDAFTRLEPVRSSISNLNEGIRLLDEGANTGVIASKLPSVQQASIEMDNLQGRLGLDVIGNTTFGALSESELKFALETALPKRMEPAALRDWLVRKRDSQEKLSGYLEEAAIFLGKPGNTMPAFLEQKRSNAGRGARNSAASGDTVSAQSPSSQSIDDLVSQYAD